MPEPDSIITTTNKHSDITQILYGLSIRGVHAKAVESLTKKTDRYQIILESPSPIQLKIAQESIAGIWDAILDEHERAVTLNGHCYFCQYDVSTLPKPTICPECGTDLDSIIARRSMRDGRKL